MKFLKTIGRSIYGPDYYRDEVLAASGGRVFGYYFRLIALVALISALGLALTLGLAIQRQAPAVLAEIATGYPEELVITLRDGVMSTNVPEPYAIPLSQRLPIIDSEAEDDSPPPRNLIVFDTQKEVSLETFRTAETVFLVGRSSLVVAEGRDGASIKSFRDWPDFTLDRTSLEERLARLGSWSRFAVPVIFIGVGLGLFIFMSLGWLFSALFGGLLVWLVLRWRGSVLGYGRAYLTTLHLLTLPILVNSLSLLAPQARVPFLTLILLLVLALVNLKVKKVVAAVNNDGSSQNQPSL